MTTQNAQECPINSLQIVPYGNQWQAIKVRTEPTLEEIIAKIILQLDTINGQIDNINSQLKTLQ